MRLRDHEHNGCRDCGVLDLAPAGLAQCKRVRAPLWECPRCGRVLVSKTLPQEGVPETGRRRGKSKIWACPRRASA